MLPKAEQRNVMFILHASQHPPMMRAGLVPINLTTFVEVIEQLLIAYYIYGLYYKTIYVISGCKNHIYSCNAASGVRIILRLYELY